MISHEEMKMILCDKTMMMLFRVDSKASKFFLIEVHPEHDGNTSNFFLLKSIQSVMATIVSCAPDGTARTTEVVDEQCGGTTQ